MEEVMLGEVLKIIQQPKIDKEKLFELIPELKHCEECECNHPAHCYNILDHSLYATQLVDDEILKLTLLLHDIGKPDVMTKDKKGITHFRGHEKTSVQKADIILERLGITGEFKYDILTLIHHHDHVLPELSSAALASLINDLGHNIVGTLLKIQRADLQAHSYWYYEQRKPILDTVDELYQEMSTIRLRKMQKGLK